MNIQNWQLLFQALTAIGALATAGTFALVFLQLKTMRHSLDDARAWNKMNTAFKLLPNSTQFNEIEDELNSSFIKLIDRTQPLSNDELDMLFTDEGMKVRVLLKNYLNELESYCVAINMGIIQEEVAARIYRYKIIRHFIELKPYIDKLRAMMNSPSIFEEIEKVATNWMATKTSQTKY